MRLQARWMSGLRKRSRKFFQMTNPKLQWGSSATAKSQSASNYTVIALLLVSPARQTVIALAVRTVQMDMRDKRRYCRLSSETQTPLNQRLTPSSNPATRSWTQKIAFIRRDVTARRVGALRSTVSASRLAFLAHLSASVRPARTVKSTKTLTDLTRTSRDVQSTVQKLQAKRIFQSTLSTQLT